MNNAHDKLKKAGATQFKSNPNHYHLPNGGTAIVRPGEVYWSPGKTSNTPSQSTVNKNAK